jgi:FkbM family methyltransferase
MDDWCRESGIYPDFLKIDTEGYDYFVLEGAGALLQKQVLGVRCEV